MRRIALLLLLTVATATASDREDWTLLGQWYRVKKQPSIIFHFQGSGLPANRTISFHRRGGAGNYLTMPSGGVIAQCHTNAQGQITDATQGPNKYNGAPTTFATECPNAAVLECSGQVPGWQDGDAGVYAGFCEDGVNRIPATGGRTLTFTRYVKPAGTVDPGTTPELNPITVEFFANSTPRTTRIYGSVKSNCSTQHSLTLWINGAIYQNLTTSAFATKDAPSTVTIDASGVETIIDWQPGKPWILAVDGNTALSGTMAWPCPAGNAYCAGDTQAVAWHLPPTEGYTSTVFFDCAPPTGNLSLQGDLTVLPHSGSHTLSVKVNGVTKGSSTVATLNSTSTQHVLISTVVSGVATGDLVEWFVDGVSQGSHAVTLTLGNCGGDPPVMCWGGEDRFNGTVSGGPGPSPSSPPVQTPPPSPPPNLSPPPGNTPPPNGNPPPGGGSPATTKDDFYDAVRRGVKDSGTLPTSIAGVGEGSGLSEDRGKLDSLEDAHADLNANKDRIKTFGAKVTGFLGAFEGEQTLGKQYSVSTADLQFPGWHVGVLTFDLDKFRGWVDVIRQIFLWIITIEFFLACVGAISNFVHGS